MIKKRVLNKSLTEPQILLDLHQRSLTKTCRHSQCRDCSFFKEGSSCDVINLPKGQFIRVINSYLAEYMKETNIENLDKEILKDLEDNKVNSRHLFEALLEKRKTYTDERLDFLDNYFIKTNTGCQSDVFQTCDTCPFDLDCGCSIGIVFKNRYFLMVWLALQIKKRKSLTKV